MPTHLLLLGASLDSFDHLHLAPAEALHALQALPVTTVLADIDRLDAPAIDLLKRRRLSVITGIRDTSDAPPTRLANLAEQVKLHSMNVYLPLAAATDSLADFAAENRMALNYSLPPDFDFASLPAVRSNDLPGRPSFLLHLNSPAWGTPPPPDQFAEIDQILNHTDIVSGHLHGSSESAPGQLLTEIMRRWRTSRPVGSSFLFIPMPDTTSVMSQDEILHSLRTQWEAAKLAWKQAAAAGRTPVWPPTL